MRLKVKKSSCVKNAVDVASIITAILAVEDPIDKEKEHFWVLGLTPRGRVKYLELVSLGILEQTLVHPREIFRLAIFEGVSSIILAHNHPSGDPSPSDADKLITKNLIKAGEIIGIFVVDHVIVGDEGEYYSFHAENPLLFNNTLYLKRTD